MLADLLRVDPRTSVRGLFLRLGPTTNVELVELSGTPRRDGFGGAADAGTAHLALFVEDLDAALDAARDRPGIEWVGADAAMPEDDPLAGYRFAFARAPWGLLLELVSYPESLAAGRAAEIGMFTPGPPRSPR
jgi:glyoxylase I family protein